MRTLRKPALGRSLLPAREPLLTLPTSAGIPPHTPAILIGAMAAELPSVCCLIAPGFRGSRARRTPFLSTH